MKSPEKSPSFAVSQFSLTVPRTHSGERSLFNPQYLRNCRSTCRGMKVDPFLSPHGKTSAKQMNDLNVNLKLKLLKEHKGDFWKSVWAMTILDMTPKSSKKSKTDKWDCIRTEASAQHRKQPDRARRPPAAWERASEATHPRALGPEAKSSVTGRLTWVCRENAPRHLHRQSR